MPQSELIEVADIVGTHGLRGDLKVRLRSGDDSVLRDASEVVLQRKDGTGSVVEIVRLSPHKGQLLLRFQGYEDINQAESLIGNVLLVAAADLPLLGDDEYYWRDLQGLKVIDRRYGDLGKLVRIFNTAAHDTYVVEGSYGEVMIPAVKQFVESVDLDEGQIRVDLPDGLVPDSV